MTIRTTPGPLALDSRDFQLTHDGVTVGLKLTYVQSPTGEIASLVVAEKEGAGWVLKEELMPDFSANLVKNMTVSKWLTDLLLPKLNAWLAKRFGSAPVPDWVPPVIVELDAALFSLKVTTADGIPQVGV